MKKSKSKSRYVIGKMTAPTMTGDGDVLRELAEVLYPNGDADREWSPDQIEAVDRILTRERFRPEPAPEEGKEAPKLLMDRFRL